MVATNYYNLIINSGCAAISSIKVVTAVCLCIRTFWTI